MTSTEEIQSRMADTLASAAAQLERLASLYRWRNTHLLPPPA